MDDLEEEVVEYSRANVAKVNIFLKDPYVKRYIRNEMISEFSFVGTIGGLLGLFLGFSFVSAVEIVYLCILSLHGLKKSRASSGWKEDFKKLKNVCQICGPLCTNYKGKIIHVKDIKNPLQSQASIHVADTKDICNE